MIPNVIRPAVEEVERLRDLVQRHRVCWSVRPENLIVGLIEIKRVQVGFDLELEGTHDDPSREPQPGCSQCLEIFRALERVARWILPPEGRDSRYEIAPYRPAIDYPHMRARRPEVVLTIKLLHRDGFDRPVDPCERQCLQEMEHKLEELGARRDRWQ